MLRSLRAIPPGLPVSWRPWPSAATCVSAPAAATARHAMRVRSAGGIGISNHLFFDGQRYRHPEQKSSATKRALLGEDSPLSMRIKPLNRPDFAALRRTLPPCRKSPGRAGCSAPLQSRCGLRGIRPPEITPGRRAGTRGITSSTRCAALRAMRRAPHEGQNPRRLQENATRFSWAQPAQRRRRKPCARRPQARKASNSSLTNPGRAVPVLAWTFSEEGLQMLPHQPMQERVLGPPPLVADRVRRRDARRLRLPGPRPVARARAAARRRRDQAATTDGSPARAMASSFSS